jgi:acyl dehydratase
MPERDPDDAVELATRPEQALLYRLNGDDNPLHVDPAVARAAGFDRPILHGLCTLGVVMHALLRRVCGYDITKPRHLALRFSAPVLPGETIRTELWDEGGGAFSFRARVPDRNAVVVTNGLFRMNP